MVRVSRACRIDHGVELRYAFGGSRGRALLVRIIPFIECAAKPECSTNLADERALRSVSLPGTS